MSKYAQCDCDYLRKIPLVIILCPDNFRKSRLHDPIELILEGRMRTGPQRINRIAQACEILAVLYDRVANSFDSIVTDDES
jgi:hypothetical protein